MQQVVYADVLIVLNMVITFILLLTVKIFAGVGTNTVRIMLASLVGGVYSLIILAPKMHLVLLLLAKAGMCISISFIAFHIRNFRKMARCCVLFLFASFLYAGILYAFSYFFQTDALIVNNGAAYFQLSAVSLVLICAAVYGVLYLLRKKLFLTKQRDMIYEMNITYDVHDIKIKALLDTGHTVKDVYTGKPVIILNADYASFLTGIPADTDVNGWADADPKLCFRLLPMQVLGGETYLPAFIANKVTVSCTQSISERKDVCVAVTKDKLGEQNYQALISEDLI